MLKTRLNGQTNGPPCVNRRLPGRPRHGSSTTSPSTPLSHHRVFACSVAFIRSVRHAWSTQPVTATSSDDSSAPGYGAWRRLCLRAYRLMTV